MWNNGNQGNGSGDVYGRLDNTKEVGQARFPFLEASGRYALVQLEEYMHNTDGQTARALFEVIDSKGHPVGSYVTKIWKLVKPAKFPNGLTDADLFVDFCRKLKGAPAGYAMGNDIRVLMKERVGDQLARGTVIDVTAVPNKKGTWMNIYWTNVPQTPADIAQMRQRIEQKGIPGTGPSQQTQPQGNFAAQQAQQALAQNPAFQQPPQQYAPPLPQQPAQPAPAPAPGFLQNAQPGKPSGSW